MIREGFCCPQLEIEERLHEDVAVAGSGHAERAACERLCFSEERGVENTVGRTPIDDVEDIQSAHDKGEIVFPRNGSVEFGRGLASTEATPVDTAAPLGTTHPAFCSFDAWTDANSLTDTNVKDDISGSCAEAKGNQWFSFAHGIGVEAAIRRRDDISRSAGAVGGASIELVIAGEVVTDGEVVGVPDCAASSGAMMMP